MNDDNWLKIIMGVCYATLVASCLIIIAMVMLAAAGCADHEAEWQAYSAEHSCKIIDRKPGQSSMTTIITNNGVQMLPYNERGISIYKCDNGTISRRED